MINTLSIDSNTCHIRSYLVSSSTLVNEFTSFTTFYSHAPTVQKASSVYKHM